MMTNYRFRKNILKGVRLFIFSILFTGTGYLVMAFVFSIIPTNPPGQCCTGEKEIYMNTNGIHVDLIIPKAYLENEFLKHLHELPGSRYVAFGWGDRNFYINTPEWSDLTFPVAFKALFLKSETAMHVTFYKNSFDTWNSLKMCDQQLHKLIVYIKSTFRHDLNGRLMKLDFEGYNEYDVFFEAEGSFSLFNTCNVWVNRGLQTAGIKTAVWTPFDFGVLYHVD